MDNECQLCGAPGGAPYCNNQCRNAAPKTAAPVYDPPKNPPPPWQPGNPCPF